MISTIVGRPSEQRQTYVPEQYSYLPMPPPLPLPAMPIYPATYLSTPGRHVTFSYSEFVEPEYSTFSGILLFFSFFIY